MPKFDFNKVALTLHVHHTSIWMFSCKFAVSINIFGKPFLRTLTSADVIINQKMAGVFLVIISSRRCLMT